MSYISFLNFAKSKIVENYDPTRPETDLDSNLYRAFKADLPLSAPLTALRRSKVGSFWNSLRAESSQMQLMATVESVGEDIRQSVLGLFDQTVSRTTGQLSSWLDANEQSDNDQSRHQSSTPLPPRPKAMENPFLNTTFDDRIRSAVLRFRSNSKNHVDVLHKQE